MKWVRSGARTQVVRGFTSPIVIPLDPSPATFKAGGFGTLFYSCRQSCRRANRALRPQLKDNCQAMS